MIKISGRQLRKGYTTGACAAAAAKAATIMLLNQRAVERVEISLPDGTSAGFEITKCSFDRNRASCSTIKDAGDDPDITDGAEICAAVSRKDGSGIEIKGGKGVGVITRPGLEIPIGSPAINTVPLQMITLSVGEVIGHAPGCPGIEVTISVPEGEELARKTLNQRLGITGGISILGTTGIVIPYSVNAYKACIDQSLDVAKASGCAEVVLTTGRRSEKFAQKELALPEACFIQVGDFIGYALEQCAHKCLVRATVWGMIGKISKLACGHLYTNISDSEVDIGFLAEVASNCGAPVDLIETLKKAVTANQVRKILPVKYSSDFCTMLCRLAAVKCAQTVNSKLRVECIVTDPAGFILGRANAEK